MPASWSTIAKRGEGITAPVLAMRDTASAFWGMAAVVKSRTQKEIQPLELERQKLLGKIKNTSGRQRDLLQEDVDALDARIAAKIGVSVDQLRGMRGEKKGPT